jgi:RNA polymerase sigma-70 factor (ECF subfamily)
MTRHLTGISEEGRLSQALTRSQVDLARSGDPDAFEALVSDRMEAVFRLGLAILGDEADAADAAQEAVIAAWRELPRLREPDRFDAWFQRIAVNSCRTALRARRRRRVREIPSAAAGSALPELDGPEVADALELHEALGRLPLDQRTVLALHYLEGRSLAEIAASLAIPVGTAKSRLFHARSDLERALREGEPR